MSAMVVGMSPKDTKVLFGLAFATCIACVVLATAFQHRQSYPPRAADNPISSSLSSLSATDLCAWCVSDIHNDTTACLDYLAGLQDGIYLQIMIERKARQGPESKLICIPPAAHPEDTRAVLRKMCLDNPVFWKPFDNAMEAAALAFHKSYPCH